MELVKALRSKALSAQEVMQAHLERIQAVNPQINAVVQLAPDALEEAHRADAELVQGAARGPLHGLPFTVKDVFDTVGLASPLDRRIRQRGAARQDATVVARLKAAGAILLAKTNCPPNGSGHDAENTVCGRTLNPHNPAHIAGGSSGGEAALVAAGGSPIGLGSDTQGGLRLPAHYCGVVTIKPTAGRMPNTGAYNQAGGLTDPRTQIGLLARSVEDLALLLPLIAGVDDVDAGVIPMPWRNPNSVQSAGLKAAYFLEDRAAPVSHETKRAVGAAAQALARAGIEVEVACPAGLVAQSREIDDFWQDLAGSPGRTIVEFYTMWDRFRTQMLQFMMRYDLLLCPAAQQPAPSLHERLARPFSYTVPFSLTGNPCVVVPVGRSANGLPIGVQIVTRHWREDVALAAGRLLEKEFGGWRPLADPAE
jgi:amidase